MLNEMNHPRSAFGAPPQGGTVHPEVSKDASGPAEPDPRRPLDASVVSAKRISGPVIRLHPADNVVVARVDVAIGIAVPSEGFAMGTRGIGAECMSEPLLRPICGLNERSVTCYDAKL